MKHNHTLLLLPKQTCTLVTPQITENSLEKRSSFQMHQGKKKCSKSINTMLQMSIMLIPHSDKKYTCLIIHQPNRMTPTDPPPKTIQQDIPFPDVTKIETPKLNATYTASKSHQRNLSHIQLHKSQPITPNSTSTKPPRFPTRASNNNKSNPSSKSKTR